MNFHELPDKDLDNMFRKAAESVDYPIVEKGWKAIEKQLEGWDRFTGFFWKFLETGFLILIISTILMIWQINDNSTDKYGDLRSAPQYGEISSRPFINEPVSKKDQEENKENNNRLTSGKSEKDKTLQTENPISEMEAVDESGDNHISEQIINESRSEPSLGKNRTLTNQKSILNTRVKPLESIFADLGANTNPSFTPEIQKMDIHSRKEVITPPLPHRFGYSAGLSIGPDFSFVNSETIGTGTYLGLFIDFEIYHRITITTGVFHTRKRYPVEGVYGLYGYGKSNNNQDPESVDVACHIIDIPVNLSFDLLQKPSFRIYASGGLSSYLMLTEEYTYHYGYGYAQQEEYILRNENQHYFGIMNLSVGYTRYVNSKWALQIEPFYKLPLEEIAEAGVRLNSFGLYLSLKYKIK